MRTNTLAAPRTQTRSAVPRRPRHLQPGWDGTFLVALMTLLLDLGCSGSIEAGRGTDDPGGSARGTAGDAGSTGGGGHGQTMTSAGGALQHAAPARVRRLTARELANTARDVFLGGRLPATVLPSGAPAHAFDNVYDALTIDDAFALSLQEFAEEVAAKTVESIDSVAPCTPGGAPADCARAFVVATGRRAYRRPLSSAETDALVRLYTDTRVKEDHATAIATVVEAMIQSPNFLFRTELGDGTPDANGHVRLSPWEVASALSYFLWRAPPDDALLAKAEAGALRTPVAIEAEARRMLASPRSTEAFRDFVSQWTEVADASVIAKSDPSISHSLADQMTTEWIATIDGAWSGKGGFKGLMLSAPAASAGGDLGRIYAGDPAGLQARAGLFTRAGFLAAHASAGGVNPVMTGRFVRVRVFCQPLPPPPPGVPDAPKDPALSTRQKYEQHRRDPSCGSCHSLMDPIGFGLERYAANGAFRAAELRGADSFALTGQGELKGTDVDGPFVDGAELAEKIATSATAMQCFAANAMSWLLGRDVTVEAKRLEIDGRALADVGRSVQPETDVKEIAVALLRADAFTTREPVER